MKRWTAALMALMLMALAAPALAEAAELSGYYGQDIAQAAEALGGLEWSRSDEYGDSYDSEKLSLRGDGTVRLIDLKAGDDYALCGVTVGMKRDDVLELMKDKNRMWDYDEEVAFTIEADKDDPAASRILVVFFDDNGKVSGAWYRATGK